MSVIMPERTTISTTPTVSSRSGSTRGVHLMPDEAEAWAQHLLLIVAPIRSAA